MKSHLVLALAFGISAVALSLAASAGQPVGASNIEYLRPADLNNSMSSIPGSSHGHVRQRLDYGKGYRYGHAVNGPLGDIIIWSAAPNRIDGSTPIMHARLPQRRPTTNLTGPRLQYNPEYGKTSKPGYGN